MFSDFRNLAGGSSTTAVDSEPSVAAVREQLARILAHSEPRTSDRLKPFLSYVVEETLAGQASQLKDYTLGFEVLGRDASFDPQADPAVPIEAGRLRRRLELYYLGAGKNDPVRTDIPKGGYAATFCLQDSLEMEASTPAELAERQ